jgi:NAD(P)-dependent dehydrogenase (short-subunit alcohol dehydrogenase family)
MIIYSAIVGIKAAQTIRKDMIGDVRIGFGLARFEEVDAAATAAEEELGPISVWINNAMTTVFAPVLEVEPEQFQRAIEVTFLGQVWGTTAALRRMRDRDAGTIVNVGSALAFIGIPLQSAYCSAKFACRGFFEAARAELIHEQSNVRMCMVHLPAVNTPQFDWCLTTMGKHPQPVPPIYQPETPARFIVDAAIDGRRSKVVGSWNKVLVGAGSVMPGFANQYAAVGAWESQLTDQPVADDRPVDLWEPADATRDFGAHGVFGAKAGGFVDPSFLRSLPTAARNFAVAARGTWREKVASSRNYVEMRRNKRHVRGSQMADDAATPGPNEQRRDALAHATSVP